MFGASGYAVPTGGLFTLQHTAASSAHQPAPSEWKQAAFGSALDKQFQCTPFPQQNSIVDISLDLMQYMSESFDHMWATSSPACQQAQQPHKGFCPSTGLNTCSSLMGSSCSTDSNQMVPESPMSMQSQQQQNPASSSDCSMRSSSGSDAGAAAGPSSSPSSSSTGMALERTDSLPEARSSTLSYDDDFVFQCYYGDTNSAANQKQQRPKQISPFATFSTFPGFSL